MYSSTIVHSLYVVFLHTRQQKLFSFWLLQPWYNLDPKDGQTVISLEQKNTLDCSYDQTIFDIFLALFSIFRELFLNFFNEERGHKQNINFPSNRFNFHCNSEKNSCRDLVLSMFPQHSPLQLDFVYQYLVTIHKSLALQGFLNKN